MSNWRSDVDISDAVTSLEAAFRAMLNDEWPAAVNPKAEIDGIRRDEKIYLSIDPQKVSDEYERVYKAALAIGDNYDAVAELRQSIRHLNNWTGAAADEFKKQLDKMEIFCDEQQTRLLRGLQGLAATYAVAVQGRDSFYGLLKATEAAAHNEIDNQKKEDTKLKSALLFDIAIGILSGDPKKLLGSALVTAVEMGKDAVERAIEGNDAQQVMDSYRREADSLNERLGNTLDHIAKQLQDQAQDAAKPAEMYKPLPLICDVGSPDFRYENFQDTVHSPGPIGPIVEDERKKYADEKKQQGPIDKRLNPGPGGRGAI